MATTAAMQQISKGSEVSSSVLEYHSAHAVVWMGSFNHRIDLDRCGLGCSHFALIFQCILYFPVYFVFIFLFILYFVFLYFEFFLYFPVYFLVHNVWL